MASLALLALGCRSGGPQKITEAGSTSVQPFAERLAEVYMAGHEGAEINVQGGGSSAGIRAVQNRVCQIGMSSRELKGDERTLHQIPVAHDGIVLIVHRSNPVSGLTLERARDIFSGRVRFWGDVYAGPVQSQSEPGSRRRRITVITREEGSGTRASFEEMVMRVNASLAETFAADALVQDSNGAVREIVASDPSAIGYISLGLVDERVRPLTLDGVVPSNSTIRDGTYPLARTFLFLTSVEPTGLTKDFIDFTLSPEGQAVLANEGLTPLVR